MRSIGDEEYRDMPPAYGAVNLRDAQKNQKNDQIPDNDDSAKTESSDDDKKNNNGECKIWLQVLPSKGGMLLAVLLTEIMTEGMNPEQMNILGNFISAVGSLIAYKAARDEIDLN